MVLYVHSNIHNLAMYFNGFRLVVKFWEKRRAIGADPTYQYRRMASEWQLEQPTMGGMVRSPAMYASTTIVTGLGQ